MFTELVGASVIELDNMLNIAAKFLKNREISARVTAANRKEKRKEKIFIQIKYIWFHNVYILIVK